MDKIKWEEALKHKSVNYDWELFKNTSGNVKASHNFMVMKDYFSKITTLVKVRCENGNKSMFFSKLQHAEKKEAFRRHQKFWNAIVAPQSMYTR